MIGCYADAYDVRDLSGPTYVSPRNAITVCSLFCYDQGRPMICWFDYMVGSTMATKANSINGLFIGVKQR